MVIEVAAASSEHEDEELLKEESVVVSSWDPSPWPIMVRFAEWGLNNQRSKNMVTADTCAPRKCREGIQTGIVI